MAMTALTLFLIVTLLAPPAVVPAAAQAPEPPPVEVVPPSPLAEPEQTTVIETGRVPYQAIQVTDGHRVGAVALNVIYVPGKAITCAAGVGLGTLMMIATFGSQYPWAVRFVEEGCGYPWYLRPRHVAGEDPKDER